MLVVFESNSVALHKLNGIIACSLGFYKTAFLKLWGAPLVGNRDVTGGARQTGGHFPFYALYGNMRSNLPESGARPRTRLESDCAVCVCVCVCVFNTSSQFHFCIHGYK